MYYDSPKRKKSWVDPGHSPTSISKRNIHRLFCCAFDGI